MLAYQHTPLYTLLSEHRSEFAFLFKGYAKYKAQVCRQVYEDLKLRQSRQIETKEVLVQQYDNNKESIDTPTFFKKLRSSSSSCKPVMDMSLKYACIIPAACG